MPGADLPLSLRRFNVSAAQINPARVVAGQIGISHGSAEKLVALGLWKKTEVQEYKGGQHQRYALTEAGMALAREDRNRIG